MSRGVGIKNGSKGVGLVNVPVYGVGEWNIDSTVILQIPLHMETDENICSILVFAWVKLTAVFLSIGEGCIIQITGASYVIRKTSLRHKIRQQEDINIISGLMRAGKVDLNPSSHTM